jgi:hypothetical protein
MHQETDSTTFLLIEWSKWAWLRRGLNLDYPGMSPFRRLGKISHPPEPLISDTCAAAVDQAVAQVAKANSECGEVLIRSYLLRESYRRIEAKTGIGRGRIGPLLRLAEAGVADLLDAD